MYTYLADEQPERDGITIGPYTFDAAPGDPPRIEVWPVVPEGDPAAQAAARRAVAAYAESTPAFARRIGYVRPAAERVAETYHDNSNDGTLVADFITAGGAYGVWRYGRYLTQYEPRHMLRLIARMRQARLEPSPAWPAGKPVPDDFFASIFARSGAAFVELLQQPHLEGQVILTEAVRSLPIEEDRLELVSPVGADGRALKIAAPLCTRLLVTSDAEDALVLHRVLVGNPAAAHGHRLPSDTSVEELAARFHDVATGDDGSAKPALAEFTLVAFLALVGILVETRVDYLGGKVGRWRGMFTPKEKERALQAAIGAVWRMTPKEARNAWYRLPVQFTLGKH